MWPCSNGLSNGSGKVLPKRIVQTLHPFLSWLIPGRETGVLFCKKVSQAMSKQGKRGNGEGSVYQRKEDNKWVGSITMSNGKRKVFYGDTKKEVREKVNKAIYEQKQGTPVVASSRQTVAQFLDQWLENTQKPSVRPRTYERYEEVIRLHINPVLGHYQLQKLTAQHIEAFYAKKLEQGLSPRTVNTFHNVLHKALEKARRSRVIVENVCEFVDRPRIEDIEINPLTLRQVKTLLAAAQGHSLEALLTLALATGMRRGELMGLKWQDISFEKGELQVRRILSRVPSRLKTEERKGYVEAAPKTKKSRRSIVIVPFALEALSRHRERQYVAMEKAGTRWAGNGFVFCTSLGTPLHPDNNIFVPFKELLKKANLPDIRFHDLRHSAATLLLGEGVHPKIVQEILGHSNVNITINVYSHVLPGMQKEAMDKLNFAFENEEEGEDTKEQGE